MESNAFNRRLKLVVTTKLETHLIREDICVMCFYCTKRKNGLSQGKMVFPFCFCDTFVLLLFRGNIVKNLSDILHLLFTGIWCKRFFFRGKSCITVHFSLLSRKVSLVGGWELRKIKIRVPP